ncbi:TATA-box binding protein [Melghirimyces profundicolus]|uniref:TATA-box binding protein n=1 Tax=Melghirimyces profundicolus TaxID=1242148 RepID=A0A2T6C2H8_9BACL|nr:YwmB family TATA-box binding protein [Melghirimyces profundicolus]PTX62531.1 TATA-box binding protein [Melghirimyces profundicolus]
MLRRGFGIPALLLISALFIAFSTAPRDEEKLIRTFSRTGAEAERYMLHHGGRTDRNFTPDDVQGLARGLAGELGLDSVRVRKTPDGTRFESEGRWSRNILLELTVINDRSYDLFVQPYISIRAEGSGLPDSRLFDTRKRLNRALQKYRIQPRTHFSIQGRLHAGGRADGRERDRMIDRIMKELGAGEVESMHAERTVSVSAYTPLFNGGLQTRGGTMNVQVAAKDGHGDGEVVLTLGTPIITIEY